MTGKNVANSIDDAMDLLKASTDDEEIEEEEEEEEEDTKKAVELDLMKAEDDVEIAQLVQADDFMMALAQNQDVNTERLTKAVEGNLNATYAVLDFLKAQQDEIKELREEVTSLKATPQPAKAAISKAEADQLSKAVGTPPLDAEIKDVPPSLTKSDIVSVLNSAVEAKQADPMDVIKAETAFGGAMSMAEIPFTDVVAQMSPGGRNAIKDYLKTTQE